ncbi:MAG: MotA/TolQ/ExbB proton channel family protein [Pseudomonadota bacterium]|nr:MotA/TolQ/ExbB proton channel family protein [Pseudomonadota bacterium]
MLLLLDAQEAIANFFGSGGVVLLLIAALTFVMWVLLFERFVYCLFFFKRDLKRALAAWRQRTDQTSWYANAVRMKLISEMRVSIEQNLRLIKVMIALCPLFGLLGTVTGMIEVFTVLSVTGGGDAKSMAGGVSRATIPTMAGMVAALSGLFANIYLNQLVTQRRARVDAQLEPVH